MFIYNHNSHYKMVSNKKKHFVITYCIDNNKLNAKITIIID